MPIDIIFSPERVNNPFEMARRDLIKALVAIKVPAPYGSWPEAEDHEAVGEHVMEFAAIFDCWLRKIGREAKSNATTNLDMEMFTEQFVGAIEGNATWELDRAAERCREDQMECAS